MPSPAPVRTVTLTPHPDTRSRAVRGIGARVARTGGILAATFALEGDLERARLPARAPRCITDKLWQHTCCEIFIAAAGAPGYYEFNLAPSGAWAVYAFARHRERIALDNAGELDPQISERRDATTLELDALIPLDRLSLRGALTLALAAVVEDQDGSLSYWALRHAPGKPDFHHPDAFALDLE